jgi:hypothetical protein
MPTKIGKSHVVAVAVVAFTGIAYPQTATPGCRNSPLVTRSPYCPGRDLRWSKCDATMNLRPW